MRDSPPFGDNRDSSQPAGGSCMPLWIRWDVAALIAISNGDVLTKATMCRESGLIEAIGDVGRFRWLTSET